MTDPIARMEQAKALLDDPLLKEAFDAIERGIVEKLKGGASDLDAEWLLSLRLLGKVRGWLMGQVQYGKIELDLRQKEDAKR